MDNATLQKLLEEGESAQVEYTQSAKDTDKLSEAVCAFANDIGGYGQPGYLLVGVNDNGEPSGLQVDDDLLVRLGDLRSNGNILPLPSIKVEKISLSEEKWKDKEVAVVTVTPSDTPPVRYKGRVCIRIGPSQRYASEQEENTLIERRTANSTNYDILPVKEASLDDLSLGLFASYRQLAINAEVIRDNHRTIQQQLASLRFFNLKSNCPTVSGLLLFGNNIRYYLPGAYIQYLEFSGTDSADVPLDEAEISGDLMSMLRELDTRIKANIHTRLEPISPLREKQVHNYPAEVTREFIVNAILHRDYQSNTPIRFYWFSDHIEISNTGGIYGGGTIAELLSNMIPSYRNPCLAEAMETLGYANRFGHGIGLARERLRNSGHPPPSLQVRNNNHAFIVKIFGKK